MKTEGRAYTLIDVKSFSEDDRVIEGIASTPRPDRVGDVVESKGAVWSTPMPLLLDHNHGEQVGHVEFAKADDGKITFRARIAKVMEPGLVKDLTDKAWHLVKYRLRAAVSIGFRGLDGEVDILKTGGIHFKKWEWLELSLVSVPAQADAVIYGAKSFSDNDAFSAIKSLDRAAMAKAGVDPQEYAEPPAASGNGDAAKAKARPGVVRLSSARDRAKPFVINKVHR